MKTRLLGALMPSCRIGYNRATDSSGGYAGTERVRSFGWETVNDFADDQLENVGRDNDQMTI